MSLALARTLRHVAPLPDMCERGTDNELRCTVRSDGVEVFAQSATVSIFDMSGAPLVAAASASVSDGSTARYVWSTPANTPLGEGYRVQWTHVFDTDVGDDVSPTITMDNQVMVVRQRLICPVGVQELWSEAPALNPSTNGGPITAMTATDQERFVDTAWMRIEQRLLSMGRRPYLVIGPGALAEVTTLSALALVFAALGHRLNEAYAAQAESYRLQAEQAWSRLSVTYNEAQDGIPDSGRRSAKPSQIWAGRGRG